MEQFIHILHLEDDAADAELIQTKIEEAGLICWINRVQARVEFDEALRQDGYDIILADFRVPTYDGMSALRLGQELHPDIPFIFVSGTMGEDAVIEGLIEGATDYVLKQNLSRLVPAIKRALHEAENRRERRRAEEELCKLSRAVEQSTGSIIITDTQGRIEYANPGFTEISGYTMTEVLGQHTRILKSGHTPPEEYQHLWETITAGREWRGEFHNKKKNGSLCWTSSLISPIKNPEGQITHFLAIQEDITERKQIEKEIRELNVNLEQRVASRTRELFALYEMAAIASQSLDMKTTLEQLLPRVLVAVDSNTGAIHLYDKDHQMLNLAAQQGLSDFGIAEIRSMSKGMNLMGKVIEEGKPLIISDTVGGATANLLTFDADIRIYAGLPMRARGVIMGVLSIVGKTAQYEFELSVEKITLLTTIADLLGVVVESIRLRQLAEQAAVLEERERLSRELHDSVTQSLYSLTLFAEWGFDLLEAAKPELAKQRMIEIGETARQALKEMRLLVYQLRPETLEQDGLVGALQQRLDAVERRTGARVLFQVEPLIKLPTPVEEGLYRITLEALNNALKHAMAGSITIRLVSEKGQITLTIEDNGIGFVPAVASSKGGLGLVSMQGRAEQFGGVLAIVSTPGEGTTVKVTLGVSE